MLPVLVLKLYTLYNDRYVDVYVKFTVPTGLSFGLLVP